MTSLDLVFAAILAAAIGLRILSLRYPVQMQGLLRVLLFELDRLFPIPWDWEKEVPPLLLLYLWLAWVLLVIIGMPYLLLTGILTGFTFEIVALLVLLAIAYIVSPSKFLNRL